MPQEDKEALNKEQRERKRLTYQNMPQEDKEALNKEQRERKRLTYLNMLQEDKEALNQERRDRYETAAMRKKVEDKINHAHFLLQRQYPPKSDDLEYFQQSPEMSLCLLYLSSGVYRFEEIDKLPTKNEIGLCNTWSDKEADLIRDDVSKLIHDIRNERLTLDEKEKLIDKYKQSRDRKGDIYACASCGVCLPVSFEIEYKLYSLLQLKETFAIKLEEDIRQHR
eukprot:12804636-Ditylum_brightwellii.AAC.1